MIMKCVDGGSARGLVPGTVSEIPGINVMLRIKLSLSNVLVRAGTSQHSSAACYPPPPPPPPPVFLSSCTIASNVDDSGGNDGLDVCVHRVFTSHRGGKKLKGLDTF